MPARKLRETRDDLLVSRRALRAMVDRQADTILNQRRVFSEERAARDVDQALINDLRAALRSVLAELDGIAHNFRAAAVDHRREVNELAFHLARATNPTRDLGLESESAIYAYRSDATRAARAALGDEPDEDPRGKPRVSNRRTSGAPF